MPSGGIVNYGGGDGLKLQNTTPGTAQVGNANITGRMIAGSFGTDDLQPVLHSAQVFGSFAGSPAHGDTGIGASLDFTNSIQENTLVGFEPHLTTPQQGSVLVGASTSGEGSNATAVGTVAVAAGEAVAIGHAAEAFRPGNIAIGSGASDGGFGNSIAIGTINTSTNQISIGALSQTFVRIGPYIISGNVAPGGSPFQPLATYADTPVTFANSSSNENIFAGHVVEGPLEVVANAPAVGDVIETWIGGAVTAPAAGMSFAAYSKIGGTDTGFALLPLPALFDGEFTMHSIATFVAIGVGGTINTHIEICASPTGGGAPVWIAVNNTRSIDTTVNNAIDAMTDMSVADPAGTNTIYMTKVVYNPA